MITVDILWIYLGKLEISLVVVSSCIHLLIQLTNIDCTVTPCGICCTMQHLADF